MTAIRVLLSRALEALLGRRRDRRLEEEISTHLQMLSDDYVSRGVPPAEARSAARRAFGGVDGVKADMREQRGLPLIDTLLQDVRFALRLLRRDRSFSATAVLVLALGIGVNNMLFAILNAHTLRGLPIRGAARLVSISTVNDANQDRGLSYPEFEDVRAGAQSLGTLLVFRQLPVIVSGDGRPAERLEGVFVAGDAPGVAGLRPRLGRGFSPADERPNAPPVALIGTSLWHTRYASADTILGQAILVNGRPATVVGVMDDRSGLPTTAEVWLPLTPLSAAAAATRTERTLNVFGRLADGATMDDAVAESRLISDRLTRDHPDSNTGVRLRLMPVNERYFGSWTSPVWLAFMTAGILVVLISAANVGNLMLGRTATRVRELAIRASLGASRTRLIRQMLIEGAVLSSLGCALGLAVALAGLKIFRSAMPADALPYWIDYSPDARVIAALVAAAVGTVFVFALLPAIQGSRTDVTRVLKDGSRGSMERGTQRWTTAFLAAEIALGMVLLAQIAVAMRTRPVPLPSDAAVDTRQVLTASVTLAGDRYATPDQRVAFYRALNERLEGTAGIASISVASAAPWTGAGDVRIDVAGRPPGATEARSAAKIVWLAPQYFETFGLTLVRGRDLQESDHQAESAGGVLVNQEFARQIFPSADPVGQRIALSGHGIDAAPGGWNTIVGVAPDIRQRPNGAEPIVYVPYAVSAPATAALLVRSSVEPTNLAAQLKDAVAAIDPDLPLYRVRTMTDVIWNARWNARLSNRLILTLTLIAVGLSMVGLYAVTMHAVARRAKEIGVRMALGARPRQVISLVVRRALWQLGFGFACGVACIRAWGAVLPTGSAAVSATDPAVLAIVGGVLLAFTLVACIVPARRAVRLDPVAAIRHD